MMTKTSRFQAVAFLLLGLVAAACDDADPTSPDAGDGRPPGRRPPGRRRRRLTPATPPAPDAPAGDRPDAGSPRDAPAADASPDATAGDAPGADTSADTAPTSDAPGTDGAGDDAPGTDGGATQTTDAGFACTGGLSRDMLCSSYCQGITSVCTGISAQYPTADACRAACAAPTWPCGNLGDTTGNTLFCRISQLAAAFTAGPTTACPNAGPTSPTCR